VDNCSKGQGDLAGTNLAQRVTLLDYLDHQQLRLAYAAADVLIVPSEYEPFGLVALEGQRNGYASRGFPKSADCGRRSGKRSAG